MANSIEIIFVSTSLTVNAEALVNVWIPIFPAADLHLLRREQLKQRMRDLMDTLNHFLEICYGHSPTLRVYSTWESMTLDAFLELQAEKVAGNQRIPPLLDPEDFYTQAEAVAAARLQSDIAAQAVQGIRTGALCTADLE